MTFEKRVVFDLDDILTVIFECDECGGRFGVPAGRVVQHSNLIQCPYCSHEWVSAKNYQEESAEYVSFLKALKAVLNASEMRNTGFSFRLEIDEPT